MKKLLRKILSLTLSAVIAGGAAAVLPSVFVSEDTAVHAESVYNDFTYEVQSDDTVTITGYTGSATDVTAGTKLTVTGAASGGAGGYNYTFEYRKSTANKWNAMTAAGNKASITFKNAGIYEFRVTVTDSAGASNARVISVIVR